MTIHEIAMAYARKRNATIEGLVTTMFFNPGEYAVVVFEPPYAVGVTVEDLGNNTLRAFDGHGVMLTKPGKYAKADEVTVYQGTHEEWLELNAATV